MKRFSLLIALIALVFVTFSSSASAAGGSTTPVYKEPQTNLGGSFSLGSYPTSPYYGSSSSTAGNKTDASFWLRLDPSKNTLRDANWSFRPQDYDSSSWVANCYLHGYRNVAQVLPSSQSWSQTIEKDGGSVWASLNFSAQKYDWETNPEMSVSGSLGLTNIVLNSTNFRYWESNDQYYSYPNGYESDPVITLIPAWYAQYDAYGRFSTSTPVPVELGAAPGNAPVPEPSTYAMLASGIAGLGLMVWRRKR